MTTVEVRKNAPGTDTQRKDAGRKDAGRKDPGRRARPSHGRVLSLVKDWLDRPMTSFHLMVGVSVLLLGFGLLMVLSASSITSYRGDGSAFSKFTSQAIFAGLGIPIFIVMSRISPRTLRVWAHPMLIGAYGLLGLVLVIGKKTFGARSWIELGHGLQFQPSELAKLALAIWLGHTLARRRHEVRTFRLIFWLSLNFILLAGLIMAEPDQGTTMVLGIVFFAALWFGGAPGWLFGLLLAGGGAGALYMGTSAGYRNVRIQAWLHPDDPALAEATYQVKQALYGMGNGGLFGAGLGQSKVKWSWLPNADSDFIFAIVGEEMGLIAGSLVILLLFGLLAYTGMRIARRNVDPFIKIVAATCTVWLVGQAAINIAYVVGLLPVTGITLPMISYGGTSLVVTMAVLGLLTNFARQEPQAAAALYSEGPGRMAAFLGIGRRPPGASSDTGWAAKREARRQAAAAKRAARVRQQRLADRERAKQRAAQPKPNPGRQPNQPRQQQARRAGSRPAGRAPSRPDERRR